MRATQCLCFKRQHNLGRQFGPSKMHLSPAHSSGSLADVHSKAVALLSLLVHYFMLLPFFPWVLDKTLDNKELNQT